MGLGWDWLGALVGGRHAQDWAGSRRLREDARCRAASYTSALAARLAAAFWVAWRPLGNPRPRWPIWLRAPPRMRPNT